MDVNAWLFLFAACGAVGSIAQILQLWLQIRAAGTLEQRNNTESSASQRVAISRLGLLWLSGLLLASLSLSVTGFYRSISRTTATNADNIEDRIKQWSHDFGFGVRPTANKEDYFTYLISIGDGESYVAQRTRDRGTYLTIAKLITVSPEHRSALLALPKRSRERIIVHLTAELSKAGSGWSLSVDRTDIIPTIIQVYRRIPISDLTQFSFIAGIDQTEASTLIVKDVFVSSLEPNN